MARFDRSSSPYEVRCPRCDVSFPIETRLCLHCGGATGPSPMAAILDLSDWSTSAAAAAEMSDRSRVLPDQDERLFESPGVPPDVPPGELSDEPSSMGRTLIRSLGGVVWIVMLIGFTLARNCGSD